MSSETREVWLLPGLHWAWWGWDKVPKVWASSFREYVTLGWQRCPLCGVEVLGVPWDVHADSHAVS